MGQLLMANPQAFSLKQDGRRFQNWIVDGRGTCAKGTAQISNEGNGVNIAPPSPARPYRFRRTGSLELPAELATVAEKVCQGERGF